jgi:hypothetical protein
MTHRPPELKSAELADIMQAVDAHLADHAPRVATQASQSTLPPLPELETLDARIRRLRQMRAPLFVVSGWRPQEIVRRALNLPIAALGYKQRRFNEELLDTLEVALDVIADLRQHIERQQQELESLKNR